MSQLPQLEKIKRWLSPGRPVRVRVMDAEPSEGVRAGSLRLRATTPDDAALLTGLIERNESHLFRWLPRPAPDVSSARVADHWIQLALEGESNGSAWRRLAVLPGGTVVGGVNLIHIERGLDWQADTNWWVSAEHTGRGYGNQIVQGMLRHAFGDMPNGLGLHKVHAGIQPDNAASERLAIKAGFTPEPKLDSRLYVNGEWQHHRGFVARS
ncbi:MAG: RimJ/RimL family protein N-acetyltransferase [Phycisphaerales bacterium]|jgi:RimJ/RimL family protein N-acetyltransferase